MKSTLKKTVIVLVVVILVLLPNLFALADNVEPIPTPIEPVGEITPVQTNLLIHHRPQIY